MIELSTFVIISIGLLFFSASTEKKIETKAQQTAIQYLYEYSLISDTLSGILWHPGIDFRGLDPENGKLYFIAKKELGRAQILQLGSD